MTIDTSDAFLDSMRQVADPLADEAIAAVFASTEIQSLRELLMMLRQDSQPDPQGLPGALQAYFDDPIWDFERDHECELGGERFFADHGPEIMLVLCCYCLPWTYSDRKGVQVLWRTGYLEHRPNRRVAETAQMIVDVLTPGGLGPRGDGIRSVQKVRLMHAAVRHLIRNDRRKPWDSATLGLPINQEDLAYTLTTFSWVVLDGLDQLGIEVADRDAQAYYNTWKRVGKLMGIVPELLPDTVADARALNLAIHRRQVGGSREGREMTVALIGLIEDVLGFFLRPMAPGLIRYFVGDSVASVLALPHRPLIDRTVGLVAILARALDTFGRRNAIRRRLSIALMQFFIDAETESARSFELPDHLHEGWRLHRRGAGQGRTGSQTTAKRG